MGGWGVILVSRPRALCLDRCGGEISDQPVASVVRVGTGVGRFPAQRHGARDAGNGRGVLGGIIGTGDTRLAFAAPGRSRAEERLGGQGDWGGVPRRHVWSTPRLVPPPPLSLSPSLSFSLVPSLLPSLYHSLVLSLSISQRYLGAWTCWCGDRRQLAARVRQSLWRCLRLGGPWRCMGRLVS